MKNVKLKLDVPTPLGNDLLIDKLLIWLTDVQIYFIFILEETNNGEILNLLIKYCYHYKSSFLYSNVFFSAVVIVL